jgi:membrane protein GlpM
MVPLFPTFALTAYYIVGSERTHEELKNTILFSLCGMIPLFVYLVAIQADQSRHKLLSAMGRKGHGRDLT